MWRCRVKSSHRYELGAIQGFLNMAVEKELKKEKRERKKGGFFVFFSRQAEGPAGGGREESHSPSKAPCCV